MRSDIDVLDAPNRETFDTYVANNRPVLVRGVVDKWRAMTRWADADLIARMGDTEVTAYPDLDASGSSTTTLSLRRLLEILNTPGQNPERLYARGEILRDLLADVDRPEWWANDRSEPPFIWIGSDSITPLHFHQASHALLAMVRGTKRVRLFAPGQGSLLYAVPFFRRNNNESRVKDPLASNVLTSFPRVGGARAVDVEVGPGEMLYIPVHWWHSVRSEGFSMSLSWFWNATWRETLWPPARKVRQWAALAFNYAHTA